MTKLFGWCLPGTAQHKQCRQTFEHYGTDYTCTCVCHNPKVTNEQETARNTTTISKQSSKRTSRSNTATNPPSGTKRTKTKNTIEGEQLMPMPKTPKPTKKTTGRATSAIDGRRK